jgi:hypothetical protein
MLGVVPDDFVQSNAGGRMTACDCPLSGYCERHKVNKTPHLLKLCRTDERYYRAWEEGRGIGQRASKAERDFQESRRQPPPPVCVHRGEVIGKASCGCAGSPEVYACSVHTYAMERKLKPGRVKVATEAEKKYVDVGYCSGCEQFEAAKPAAIYPAIETRNLIYHVYPAPGWLDAVHEIAQHLEAFNGRVLVALALDAGMGLLAARDEIRTLLQPDGILITPNDPNLREAATFRRLLESILSDSPTDATFYAHTKGITTADGACGAMKWRRVMTDNLLGRWGDAMGHLRRYPFVGTHKMIWPVGQASPFPTRLTPAHSWMHAGTFWWFRNDAVAAKYRPELIVPDRYGVEAFPAQMFPHHQAYSMFQPWEESEAAWPQRNPYDPAMYEADFSR